MLSIRYSAVFFALMLCPAIALAQPYVSIAWPMLPNPAVQEFEDPYRDLAQPQFKLLMALAETQITLSTADLDQDERAMNEERATRLADELTAQGLDPYWILSQRDVVAERRWRAAMSTNPAFEDKDVELRGFLLTGPDATDGGVEVAYLLPDRGVCMHLPPPMPNQLIELKIDEIPETVGACVPVIIHGRLSANQSKATVPAMDHVVTLWSEWNIEVRNVTLPGEGNPDDNATLVKR